MSRRRYLSTDISIDTAVNRLARTAGDFAVMLYTWMIPHCDDDGIVHGDAEEIILQVIPGRRDKKIEDVTAALAAMQEQGLIEWDQEGRCARFPAGSFYKYQTYIKPERRRGAQQNIAPESPIDADNAANQRKTPQNTVSLSHSHPIKHSHSHSDTETPVVLRTTAPTGAARGGRMPVSWPAPADLDEMDAYGESLGVRADDVASHVSEFRDYWQSATKNATSMDWVKRWRSRFSQDVRDGRVGVPKVAPNGRASPGAATFGEKARSNMVQAFKGAREEYERDAVRNLPSGDGDTLPRLPAGGQDQRPADGGVLEKAQWREG